MQREHALFWIVVPGRLTLGCQVARGFAPGHVVHDDEIIAPEQGRGVGDWEDARVDEACERDGPGIPRA